MNPALLTPIEAQARMAAAAGAFVLVDCREAKELAVASVPGAMHLPMMEVPARLAELDKSKEIAVMCHHGMRSGQVAAYLAKMGFQRVASVAGGIDRWSREVDSKIPRY